LTGRDISAEYQQDNVLVYIGRFSREDRASNPCDRRELLKERSDAAETRIVGDSRAGRMPDPEFVGQDTDDDTGAADDADRRRDSDAGPYSDDHRVLEARPVAPVERTQCAAREARLLQGLSAGRRRGRELVHRDGVGQVVTLRLPASRLREVNRVLENSAWGAYRTEFYPTYDYKAVGIAQHDKAQ
jgi:hypothetical protein